MRTARLLAVAALWGLIGLVAVPVLVFVGILALSYLFDPRCGSPGDSGGCEMGAAAVSIASAMPAFALFFLIGTIFGLRRRNRQAKAAFDTALDGPASGSGARDEGHS